jgi:hypothetical protein
MSFLGPRDASRGPNRANVVDPDAYASNLKWPWTALWPDSVRLKP